MAVQGVSVAGIQAVLETSRTTLEVTSLAPHRGLSQNELARCLSRVAAGNPGFRRLLPVTLGSSSPAPLHLSPFCPPDRDLWVDSPALSARGPDLPCTTQDEAGLMGKFDT